MRDSDYYKLEWAMVPGEPWISRAMEWEDEQAMIQGEAYLGRKMYDNETGINESSE